MAYQQRPLTQSSTQFMTPEKHGKSEKQRMSEIAARVKWGDACANVTRQVTISLVQNKSYR